MREKVAIVGYAQTHHQADIPMTREDMVFEVAKGAAEMAGISREDIDTVINASNDYLDGRTISELFLVMPIGAYLKDYTKVEMDGAFAVFYGMLKILSGTHDIALVVANTQGSTFNPHQVSVYTLDPLFDRQVGVMNDVAAAAIQARMYMSKYDVLEEQLADVSVKNLSNAAKNPYAHRKIPGITIDEVLDSKLYYDPVRELTMSPISDGACAVVLASEKKAWGLTDDPVWIEGVGSSQDSYLRDRNLTRLEGLEAAARRAYKMAGIRDPFAELDVAEVSERYAHEELMIYEALGFCEEGRGADLIESGVTYVDDQLPVNPSGGALSADPITATGLIRIVEAAMQIRGEARNQVSGASLALAHGQTGLCAQSNIVYILGGEA
ncbi:MAG: thiolase family protein [Candidatus Freyarchaeota archaeon]|nr:thiolase family protein [Candidatus Freyarchaeota archaeon]